MSLFNINDVLQSPSEKENIKSDGIMVNTINEVRFGAKGQRLENLIGAIEPGKTIHFKTAGEWSCHELVMLIAQQLGICNLYFTTYAIGEFQARMLAKMKDELLLKNIFCIIDKRADTRTPGSMQLMNNIGKIKLAHCHAKVSVVEGKQLSAVIIGSANWSSNPRIEVSVICYDTAVANFHKEWILKEFEK